MILIRNAFQLKFGKARDAVAIWKDGIARMKKMGLSAPTRLLTDLTGSSYTLIFEETFENLAAYEQDMKSIMGTDEWKEWYQQFIPLCESGYREILTIVE